MISVKAFWYYLVILAGIMGSVGFAAGYVVAPEQYTTVIGECFGDNVQILGYGPITERDQHIIDNCGYQDRVDYDNTLTTPMR